MCTKESAIEGAFARWATSYRLVAVKLGSKWVRGLPDRMILGPGARVLFLEFKRPGESATKYQDFIHRMLRSYGFTVRVVDSVKEAKEICSKFFYQEK